MKIRLRCWASNCLELLQKYQTMSDEPAVIALLEAQQGAQDAHDARVLQTEEQEPNPAVDVDDPEVKDVALRFADMPADLVGVREAKKGAKKGRKAGDIGTVVEPRTYYALIKRDDGTARLFNENKAGRVSVIQTNYRSPPKPGQELIHCVVSFTDGTYRLFRAWENIMPISRQFGLRIKTVYTVIG
eukprot:g24926.t1